MKSSLNVAGGIKGVDVSDATVSLAGKAITEIGKIADFYKNLLTEARTSEQKEALIQMEETVVVRAIGATGLSVDEFHRVIDAAEEDTNLARRITDAIHAA